MSIPADQMRVFLKTANLDDMTSIVVEVLSRKPDSGPVWVFAYGSLIWNPDMVFTDDSAANLSHYFRDFCLSSIVHRGTPECPGVVLGVRHQTDTHCFGHAFCLDADHLHASLERLLRRELVTDCYLPLWLPIKLASGEQVNALTMVVNEEHERFMLLTEEQKLERIQQACGPRGSNYEYFANIARHMQQCGIPDPVIDQLYRRLKE